ncbi:MAG: amidohydrolase [Spirochaetales bacterium]|nr:amidohydrolase [Spirochaetales bacterium]
MILRNLKIVDLITGSVSEPSDLLIEDGRIKSIDSYKPGPMKEGINVAGMYALPGLVNTHAHTAMTLLKGSAEDLSPSDWFNRHIWMYEKNLTPHDVFVGTLLGAAEMLLNGVTWVADHYFFMEEAFKAYEEAGMRATLCRAVFGTDETARQSLEESAAFIRDFGKTSPRIKTCLGPHSPYLCPEDFLKETARLAEQLQVPLHIHVSETAAQVAASLAKDGRTPVRVLEDTGILRPGTILAHAYHATDEDLELIKKHDCGIAHCAKTYMKFGDLKDFLPRALDAGVKVGLGTDGPASNNTMDIFETARLAALLAKVSTGKAETAPIRQILPLFFTGGRILGEPAYGTLAPGAPADLVLLSDKSLSFIPRENLPAHLLYSLQPGDIDTVIVDGEIVVWNGTLAKIDLDALLEEAASIYRRLAVKDGGKPMQRYNT